MNSKEKYEELFDSNEVKAKAFDMIAEQYYYGNFGMMQKSDFETLMFSIYIDRILDKSESDMKTYSDYNLSKYLGITQAKVGNLKIKKELKYHYEGFDWKKSFKRLVNNGRYENEKIQIYIPDKNLFNEIKNAIEENNGYIDVQLNAKLLQIRPEFFIDLMKTVGDENDRKIIQKNLEKELKKRNIKLNMEKSFYEVCKENPSLLAINVLKELIGVCVPSGDVIKKIIDSASKIKQNMVMGV